jgi:hypothetical protein
MFYSVAQCGKRIRLRLIIFTNVSVFGLKLSRPRRRITLTKSVVPG